MKNSLSLFLCGDVMTGRGIDQILPFPSNPKLYESYVKDARHYVELAKQFREPIIQPVNFEYIWGDALHRMKNADARIINLETSITFSNNYYDKGINYRMSPKNISCLTAADINCCALANNHVLDWGKEGLLETLETLENAEILYTGAGKNIEEAQKPAILTLEDHRVLVFSFGLASSGIPFDWQATATQPGVNLLVDWSIDSIKQIAKKIKHYKRRGDLVIASIHWGGNWGYEIPKTHQTIAHNLIDHADVDIIHGHSSHHIKGLEVYKNKPIIYGCGDFINDYEGISGQEFYRDDLGLMYFIESNPINGDIISLQMVPTKIKNFQITSPKKKETDWMLSILNREGRQFNTSVERIDGKTFKLTWN